MVPRSQDLFAKARRLIPGGVNSPVRAGKAVGVDPPFIARGQGARLWDVDGNAYIDYVGSWGPLILGHARAEIVQAVQTAAALGTSYGAPTELEVRLAESLTAMMPSIEMVRLVNSGTEATMSAIRLARGWTGRSRLVKFEGCYHGHADSLLVSAGSGVATLGLPGSPGVPEELARLTLALPFNDLAAVEKAFAGHGREIAAVIVEPVPCNMGLVLPREGFLEGLRRLTAANGALLIFDEVITGFRLAPGGAQEIYGVRPDLTCLGKIIGGGLPVGAYGGRRDIMAAMAPEGQVYQAGTLSGNPLAVTAGLVTLDILRREDPYAELARRGGLLFEGLAAAAAEAGLPVQVNALGSVGTVFFADQPVTDFASARRADADLFRAFYRRMLAAGIYLAPSPFEALFVSTAHTDQDIALTLDCARKAFAGLTGGDGGR